MATQQAVIKTLVETLDKTPLQGIAALDTAIQVSSAFYNTQNVINQLIKDCKSYVAADAKNGWEKFLLEKCGIDLKNKDTGAITGLDAGGSKVKTTESIVPESGSLIKFTGQSFAVNGLTFTLEKSFKKLSAEEKFIWQGLRTWWAKGALDLIKTSYGYSFTDSDVHFKKVTVKFVKDNSTTELAWNAWHDRDSTGKADGKVDSVELVVNMNYYGDIVTTNSNGQSKNSTPFYIDKTLAHELTHTLMHAKVLSSYELPKFFTEGWAEVTIGIDDERAKDITYLAKNPSALSNTLNSKSADYVYSAGYIFMRYLVKQAATGGAYTYNAAKAKSQVGTASKDTINNAVSSATIQALGGNDLINNVGTKTKIFADAGKDTIYNYGAKVTINGGNDNDKIYNYSTASSVSIFAGTGNDTIYNYAKNVTIEGGNDNDRIYNYASSAVTILGGEGADYIANWGGAASISGGNGEDTIYGDEGADTILGGAGNDLLFGDAGNDKLYGGNDADTLKGGKGNDSLWGNTGADTFIYTAGDGKDTIYGFDDKDTLTLDGLDFTPSYKKGIVSLKFADGGSISFKNFKATNFHIDNDTYKISGSKFKKQ